MDPQQPSTPRPAPHDGRIFVDGAWRPGASGRHFVKRDPADTRVELGEYALGDAADVDAAVQAARRAQPAWQAVPAPKRGEILFRFAGLLAAAKEDLSRTITLEMGKVIEESRGDVQEAIDLAYLYAGEGRRLYGDTAPSELPDKWSMSVREPIGVAAIITPWNVPVAIPALRLMPALVSGNTAVWKPASDTPGCAVELVRLLEEAGVPPGVVNLVTGSGDDVGMPLAEHPNIDVVAFTGSSEVGRRIAGVAGAQLKRVTLELGGKNAIAVMPDADLDLAVESIVWAAYGTTGQRCTACSRLVLVEEVADTLLERLAERVAALRLGHGLDPATEVGPLVNEAAREKVAHYMGLARRDGRLVCGTEALTDETLAHGWFAAPAIVDGVGPDHALAQEEIFGPLLTVIRVPDYEAAARVVNDARYGLSSSIFTNDLKLAFRALREFRTGLVYVNGGTIGAETQLPFGGIRDTGNGHRDSGRIGLDNFTEWKTAYIDYSGRLQRAQIDNQPGG
ncbi:aldehyde dehydrogenase family protein [soil metagenome]